jgi:hypothetical protein
MIITTILIALSLFIAFGLYKASGLQQIQIVKTVQINANSQQVFDMVKYLGNFPKWSPFLVADPSQKYKVLGTDGTVGAQYHWDGNGGKDLGFQEIKEIEELKYVGMQCDIQKPFQAKPTFEYYFTETPEGIQVKQDFKVQTPLLGAFFMWLGGAKASMAKMNQDGLNNLKKATEC